MNINIVNKCSICDEILNGDQAGLYYLYAKSLLNNVESRILYENEKFIVMPSLGPVAECHLLVLPKKHICSYAVWDQESLCEAAYVMDDMIQKSQYIRFLIADILGKPDCGDWKKNPGILEVNKMILEMKKDFQNLF